MLIGIDAHNLESGRTGVGRYLINLLQQWSDFGVTNQISGVNFILYFKDEIPGDVPESELFESKLLKVGSTAKFVHWDLPRLAKKDKVDILFCPGYVAPVFYSGKVALVLHDIIYEAHPEWFNWPSQADKILLKWVSRRAAKKAAVIFTCSKFSKSEIIRCFGVSFQKIFVAYLAADPFLGKEKQSGGRILKKFGLGEKFIFYTGSIFSRRHLRQIIKAFGQLAQEKKNLQFFLSGRDLSGQRIDELISQQNKEFGRNAISRVDFVGDSDLKSLYSACAFFIWLSDYEGFGLPPLEAMSAGAPVITSDATSLKEVAGEAALLVKNNSDVEEIYCAMKKVIEDENLRKELVEKGRYQAAKFSWEKCAKDTLEKLKSVGHSAVNF